MLNSFGKGFVLVKVLVVVPWTYVPALVLLSSVMRVQNTDTSWDIKFSPSRHIMCFLKIALAGKLKKP